MSWILVVGIGELFLITQDYTVCFYQEEDLAMIAAQQYFIEFQADLNMDRLLNLLPNYIPDYCLTNAEKSIDRWAALIVQAYKKVTILALGLWLG